MDPNISIGEAGIIALLGYATIFAGIALLFALVLVLSKLLSPKKKAAPVVAAPAAAVSAPTAPGVAGTLKLHDVEPKTAAMLMAIVADKMGKPINELRFISIKEVK